MHLMSEDHRNNWWFHFPSYYCILSPFPSFLYVHFRPFKTVENRKNKKKMEKKQIKLNSVIEINMDKNSGKT